MLVVMTVVVVAVMVVGNNGFVSFERRLQVHHFNFKH